MCTGASDHSPSLITLPMEGSSLWLLEAKPFATEERSEKASTVKFWLRPGTAIVGRQVSDVPVEEDKSISRKHAEITVLPAKEWRQEGGAPCVIVKGAAPPPAAAAAHPAARPPHSGLPACHYCCTPPPPGQPHHLCCRPQQVWDHHQPQWNL